MLRCDKPRRDNDTTSPMNTSRVKCLRCRQPNLAAGIFLSCAACGDTEKEGRGCKHASCSHGREHGVFDGEATSCGAASPMLREMSSRRECGRIFGEGVVAMSWQRRPGGTGKFVAHAMRLRASPPLSASVVRQPIEHPEGIAAAALRHYLQ